MHSLISRFLLLCVFVSIASGVFAQSSVVPAAGTGVAGFSGDGGPAPNAKLNLPADVALDAQSNFYIADRINNRVRKVAAASGTISTVAGNGSAGVVFTEGGAATDANLNEPFAVAVDGSGNLYIADFSFIADIQQNRESFVHVVNTAGDIHRIVTSSSLTGLLALAVDPAGNVYVSARTENRIFKLSPSGALTTIAGTGTGGFTGDGGPATAARINNPARMAFDGSGNLYFADSANARIRKIAAGSNIITTVAGMSAVGFGGDGGAATSAQLNDPEGVEVDAAGDIIIADTGNLRIRRVSAGSGIISTVIAPQVNGQCGVFAAPLQSPLSVAVTASGSLYIDDQNVTRVWKADLHPTPASPTLSSISPPTGGPGTQITVTLAGTGFAANVTPGCQTGAATVNVSGTGITVGNVTVVSDTSLTADLAIASDATIGPHNVTVSTTGGTSSPVQFTVAVPQAPPPTLTSISPSSGVRGTSVTVTFTGTNFDTRPGNTTVSADGTGMSVSQVLVTNATSLIAVIGLGAGATLGNHNLKVATPSGSSSGAAFTVLPGGLSFVYDLPQMLNPTDQVPVQIALAETTPDSVSSTLTLTFTPNAVNNADDPNVTLVNADASARNSAVTFPANTVTAHLAMANSVLQAGTVAGTIELSMTNVQVGGVNVNSTNNTFDLQIPQLPPVLTSVRIVNRTAAGFDVEITGYSTTRDITAATFDFGAATGQKLLTVELKPDVNSPFTVYYQSPASDPTGSAFVYTQPFIVKQGTVNAVASVTVSLANTAGTSNAVTAQ